LAREFEVADLSVFLGFALLNLISWFSSTLNLRELNLAAKLANSTTSETLTLFRPLFTLKLIFLNKGGRGKFLHFLECFVHPFSTPLFSALVKLAV
jgi:hypothetical protein